MKINNSESLPLLSIIIPAYNEENTIRSLIISLRKILNSLSYSFEIIIIDDGSTDNTKIEIKKSKVRLISLNSNRGKGFALKAGFFAASGQHILTLDADGSHRIEDMKYLIETYFKTHPHMLIGSRFVYKPKIRFTSPTNIVGNKLFKIILFFISLKYITDSQSGLRIFDKRILNYINLKATGYDIESELTSLSIGMGFIVNEIPIRCKPRIFGQTKLNYIIDGIKISKTLIFSYYRGRKIMGNIGIKG